jgi:hypothetical protein
VPRRPNRQITVLVATTAVTVAFMVVVVVSSMNNRSDEAPVAVPFVAGRLDSRTEQIQDDGPVGFSDPRGGTRSFYLDLEDGRMVALHVLPPGGNSKCIVQWNRDDKHYEDCKGEVIDPRTLRRFPIRIVEQRKTKLILVDLRSLLPPSGS